MADGDEAVERCANDLLWKVASRRAVRRIEFQDGLQPTDLLPDELAAILPKSFFCSKQPIPEGRFYFLHRLGGAGMSFQVVN